MEPLIIVVALNVAKLVAPDAVNVLIVRAETFTFGFAVVPPVYVFKPFCK